jgi:hypothetical protein
MGIDAADFDRDGWLDIVKTNFSDDANNLYHNDRNGEFTDVAGGAGIGAISIPYLGFGAKFLDFDNDGWSDLFVANGHVDPQVEGQSFGVGYAERRARGNCLPPKICGTRRVGGGLLESGPRGCADDEPRRISSPATQ